MKNARYILIAGLILCAIISFGQKDYPEMDVDYSAPTMVDFTCDEYTIYSYYMENTGSEPIVFFNFSITPNDYHYEILRPMPSDIFIVYPGQKISYMQIKVYDTEPNHSWFKKFLRISDESSIYPEENRDYVFYWESVSKSVLIETYTYHLKNVSSKNIRFYNFILTDNGGIYYLVDNLFKDPVVTKPGQSIQIVKYDLKSGESPSIEWDTDWSDSIYAGDLFCSGLNNILEASKEAGFGSVKGAIKNKANNVDIFFDQYFCADHVDGITDEIIEDILFFYQYVGTVGAPAPLAEINSRFYEYKRKLEACLPAFPQKADGEDDDGLLKAEYEAEVESNYHYLKLEVVNDAVTGNYKLALVVEQVY